MFATNKVKQPVKPAATNSGRKFAGDLSANRSFDTAQKLLDKSGKLKQTTLCLHPLHPTSKRSKQEFPRQDSNRCETETKKVTPDFFYMPLPLPKDKVPQQKEKAVNLNQIVNVIKLQKDVSKREPEPEGNVELAANGCHNTNHLYNNPMLKNGRNLLVLMGKVDFCLKMHKLYAEINAMWDVYGKLLKIVRGKQRCEHILLLRNASGGPVLQCVYYDFNKVLKQFENGCFLRIIGSFSGDNRFRTHKLQHIENSSTWEQHFTRIQNVTSFVLLQKSHTN